MHLIFNEIYYFFTTMNSIKFYSSGKAYFYFSVYILKLSDQRELGLLELYNSWVSTYFPN
jgi:hypothetical protein